MNFAGIIAEYNPFHNGHALQIAELRRKGASTIAVCMSTGAVQRGDLPVLPEPIRVRAALENGADLVIALPVPYANAGAEQFAAAGVHLLAALGCDTLAFGAETPDISRIMAVARALLDERFPLHLRTGLKAGLPFAAARAQAAEELCPGAQTLLSAPNNILAVEYCKAILKSGVPLTPLPMPRLGTGHDTAQTGCAQGRAIASATLVRQTMLSKGVSAAQEWVPPTAAVLYREAAEQGLLLDPEKFSTAVLARLRGRSPAELACFRGMGEGLENRLSAAANQAENFDDLCERIKTKRYPTARLRRLILDAVLEIPAAGLPPLPPYLHVLGARRSALPLLGGTPLPVSSSLADLAKIGPQASAVAELHSRAVDFSSLCRVKTQPVGLAYTSHVVLL